MSFVYLGFLLLSLAGMVLLDVRERLFFAQDPRRAALVLLAGLVFFLAVTPQFVVPTAPLLPQYLAIGATMVVVDLVVMGLYTSLSARLLLWLNTPGQQKIVNRTFSGLFATAAVVLSLVRRGATA